MRYGNDENKHDKVTFQLAADLDSVPSKSFLFLLEILKSWNNLIIWNNYVEIIHRKNQQVKIIIFRRTLWYYSLGDPTRQHEVWKKILLYYVNANWSDRKQRIFHLKGRGDKYFSTIVMGLCLQKHKDGIPRTGMNWVFLIIDVMERGGGQIFVKGFLQIDSDWIPHTSLKCLNADFIYYAIHLLGRGGGAFFYLFRIFVDDLHLQIIASISPKTSVENSSAQWAICFSVYNCLTPFNLWNSLPRNIPVSTPLSNFKSALFQFIGANPNFNLMHFMGFKDFNSFKLWICF